MKAAEIVFFRKFLPQSSLIPTRHIYWVPTVLCGQKTFLVLAAAFIEDR